MAGMDFSWALNALKQGFRVRRSGWVPGLYLIIADGIIMLVWSVWVVNQVDVLACDWNFYTGG